MKEANMNILYEKVRQHRGAMNSIASNVKCSREWVRRVLKGDYFDAAVIMAALDEVKEREEKRVMLRNKIIAMTATM